MIRCYVITMLLCAIASTVLGAEPKIVQRGHESASDAPSPFKLEIQRKAVRYDGFYLWGKVSSPQLTSPDNVTIIFTGYDADDKFLGRTRASLSAASEPGVAYFDNVDLDTAGTRPTKIVWEISNREKVISIDNIKVNESPDRTAQDVPLTFKLQRLSPSYSGLSLWGKVENTSTKKYENLKVVVAAYDADGRLLARTRATVAPGTVGPNQVGYVDETSLDTDGKVPSTVEWKVIAFQY